ncbi:MAG: methyl-accepting chemotaxis protein [candidate division WOR-3 bacterium]|nr:methyl-accepting chemotaxis protein [candidate division WOR-3 bacterium]
MMSINEESRLKGLNFNRKSSIAIMFFCLLFEFVFLTGFIFKFFLVPAIIPILTAAIFLFGLAINILTRRNIYSPIIPYIITTTVVVVLTICLSFINPLLRIPFFLIYFYIVLHPGYLLGIKNGIYSLFIIDCSYVMMVFLTQSLYPETNLGMEIVKLIFFTIISFLLLTDFDRDLLRLKRLKEVLKKVESGDLTVKIEEDTSTDEIYFLSKTIKNLLATEANIIKLIIETSKHLNEISAQIASTSNELSTAISEIVSTTQKMTEGVDRQYQELDKSIVMGKTLSEISFSVVDNIKKVEGYAESFSTSASDGLKMSDEVLKNIEIIGSRYEYLIELMTKLHEVSDTITKIIETINKISEKINILSLNASIEAARAGEFGRGFAIVADEIKKLADNTQNSAMEIGEIVKEMIDSIKTVVESSEEVRRALADGNQIVKSTTGSLRTISSAVIELNSAIKNIKNIISKEEEEITAMLKQIEDSFNISKENSTAAEEILASLQEQSAATEEFAATSQELLSITERLAKVIQNFKI